MKQTNRTLSHLILLSLVAAAFAPFLLMLNVSLRRPLEIAMNLWAWPTTFAFENYYEAWSGLAQALGNTFLVSGVAIAGVLFLSLIGGYAFARLQFPGKEALYALLMALLMIPGILLLTPKYVLAMDLGLRDSFWGLWWFYFSHGQVMGIFLTRVFFESLPEEIFESARLEGASEWDCLWFIAFPLGRTVLVTIAVVVFLGFYNDLIWPMLVLNDPGKETLMVALLKFVPVTSSSSGRPDIGVQTAGYVIGSIPVLIVFWIGMKAYTRGILAGAVKS